MSKKEKKKVKPRIPVAPPQEAHKTVKNYNRKKEKKVELPEPPKFGR